jgi:hypothetical protein
MKRLLSIVLMACIFSVFGSGVSRAQEDVQKHHDCAY